MKRKATKATAGFLAAAMLANGCLPKQASTWKTESVVEVKAEKIDEVKELQVQYYISSEVYEDGKVEIHVTKNISQVTYELSQTVRLEKQREFHYRKSRAAGIVGVLGVAGIGTGLALRNDTKTIIEDCRGFSDPPYCPEDFIMITSGIVAISGFIGYANSKNKERPTTHYRTEKLPMGEVHKTEKINVEDSAPSIINYWRDDNSATDIINPWRDDNSTTDIINPWRGDNVSPTNVPVFLSSNYFSVNGSNSALLSTNEDGNINVQLDPINQGFAFSSDAIANTGIAQELRQAGYNDAQFMPLLQQAVVPISYNITIATQATDGQNAGITVPVKGYEIPQKALEKIVLGL